MAKQQNNSGAEGGSFDKRLNEDIKGWAKSPSEWTQARNAVNNTTSGDIGEISNEMSNYICSSAPYTIIGTIHLVGDEWAIFSTNDTDSEIGRFVESDCSYTKIVNDPCLNFNRDNLIIGVGRKTFECNRRVYWDDARNPSRTLDLDDVPWIQECETIDSCEICTDTTAIDCAKIRLEPLMSNLSFTVSVGPSSGELPNGQYYVAGAYVVNGERVTDYSLPSLPIGLFTHDNLSSSLEVTIENADDEAFDEFELVLIRLVSRNTTGRIVGTYSTRQKTIVIDNLNLQAAEVPFGPASILIRNPIADSSDGIFQNGKYLIRTGPTDKFDFNYQPLANQIKSKWVSIEYDTDYYRNGGTHTGYMRDETYAFFIRWIYNTGDKSNSYHIPGRVSTLQEQAIIGGNDSLVDTQDGVISYRWRVQNTAIIDPLYPTSTLPDGGNVIGGGDMAYWESSEIYDDDLPEVWNGTYINEQGINIGNTTNTNFDLCGKEIRHHKFPDNASDNVTGNIITNHYNFDGTKIRVMGVAFENILPPVNNEGVVIDNIVGYEVLRGSRLGNKTVIAKGMINNMREYDIPNSSQTTGKKGLYANYPFNPVTYNDRFLNAEATISAPLQSGQDYVKNEDGGGLSPYGTDQVKKDIFTFHSPELSFRQPYLTAKELKIYGEIYGTATGNFEEVEDHPKHKLIGDAAFIIATVLGLGYVIGKMDGGDKKISIEGSSLKSDTAGTGTAAVTAGLWGLNDPVGTALWATKAVAYNTAGSLGQNTFFNNQDSLAIFLGATFGSVAFGLLPGGVQSGDTKAIAAFKVEYRKQKAIAAANFGVDTPKYTTTQSQDSDFSKLPRLLRAAQGAITFTQYWAEGIDAILNLIYSLIPFTQYAYRYQAHCLYNKFKAPTGTLRNSLLDQNYVGSNLQTFASTYQINNIYRSKTVALQTQLPILNTTNIDNTQKTLRDVLGASGELWKKERKFEPFTTTAASHYVGIKQRQLNQYGQIANIIQIPISTGTTDRGLVTNPTNSPIFFNGDVYIGRYSEKNTMFFFYNWMENMPDGTEFDYRLNKMLTHPKFWMDTEPFDLNEFVTSIGTSISNFNWSDIQTPRDKFALDRKNVSPGFRIKNAAMYLFNSGVREFFVESEINVDYRDYDEGLEVSRHYDHREYSDLKTIFSTNYIKSGNFYKYDYSLSINKLFNNLTVGWGNVQARNYNPAISETCYKYRPNRVLYSLPQSTEIVNDNWRIFLANNYKDFGSRVSSVEKIGKNGAIFFFDNESPIQVQGVDILQTDQETKITIGDGGLFSQPMQNVSNANKPHEYGSCQNRLSVINTPAGLYYISQNQGKIFQMGTQLTEISNIMMKWWFSKYLPYKLTDDFPDFELIDNPVVGIGCQSVFDNDNQVCFFSKKDYKLRKDIEDLVEYTGKGKMFTVNKRLRVELGDPRYFEDASWTVSYDPKSKGWISYHDWHPDLTIPSKNTFMTTKMGGIWKHADTTSSYCKFYGKDYPFEVEFTLNTKTEVHTLRNILYYMEVFKYAENGDDRFHVLDFNFDEAIVYNSEQCSGLLDLNLMPKNNAPKIVTYPRINPTSIDILYSKEEQKYRFNQFWDVTDNRGEFDLDIQRTIFLTEPNGYVRNLNPDNLNYAKEALQRKKFRHYKNTVLLRRKVSGDKNMKIALAVQLTLRSPR